MSRDVIAAARRLQAEFDEMGVGRQREYVQPTSSAMVVVDPVFMDELNAVRAAIAPTLTDAELRVFALIAQRKGLDPFSGQITAIKRNTRQGPRVAYQTGIDGHRSLAEKTGQYLGSDEPDFGPACACGHPTTWHPEWARVVVHRIHPSGRVVDQPARAKWHEFVPQDDFMWNSKPEIMLAKCAEAQALRKAFPWVLGDLYIPEELARGDDPPPSPPAPLAARSVVAAKAAALRGGDDVPPPPERPDDPPAAAVVRVSPMPDAGGPGASAGPPASPDPIRTFASGEVVRAASWNTPPLELSAQEFQTRADAAGLSKSVVRDRAHELFPNRRSADFTREDWGALFLDLVSVTEPPTVLVP